MYMTKIKDFIKNIFSGSKETKTRDMAGVIKRVDAQVGRAVTRLSDR